jgi:hypothetical protein
LSKYKKLQRLTHNLLIFDVSIVSCHIYRIYNNIKVMDDWEARAARKRQDLQDSIPKSWIIPEDLLPPENQLDVTTFPESSGWFTSEELAITGQDAVQLLSKLASGELKAEVVTQAFCKRAAAAHQLVSTLSRSLMLFTIFTITRPS